jgi:hypothetical protein
VPISAHTLRGMDHAASALVERLRRRVAQERHNLDAHAAAMAHVHNDAHDKYMAHTLRHEDQAGHQQLVKSGPSHALPGRKSKLADDETDMDDDRTDDETDAPQSDDDYATTRSLPSATPLSTSLEPKQTINPRMVSWMTPGGWSKGSACALPDLPVLRSALCTRRQISDGVCGKVSLAP